MKGVNILIKRRSCRYFLFRIKENYQTEDSHEMIGNYIEFVKEFEYLHKHIHWGINSPLDYIESIDYFPLFKINQWRNV